MLSSASNHTSIVEKGHDLLNRALEQALQLRGSRDFAHQAAYVAFVQSVAARLSRRERQRLEVERAALRPLPSSPLPNYTTLHPKVRRYSTVRVGGRVYSVPSRLIGHQVEVRQYANELEVRYKGVLVERLPRLRGADDARIDYRHVIWSLVRKPGAFRLYRYQEQLFPTPVFRAAYGVFKTHRGERADVEYVRVLHLAASTMESTVERALTTLLETGRAFDYLDVKDRAAPTPTAVPKVQISAPDLAQYDQLLEAAR